MGISAIALLRLESLPPRAGKTLPSKKLDDCVLYFTRTSFASEPAELSRVVREQLGDELLERHGDARGIFFIPDVAVPSARSYAAVIAEIGEGGVWGPLRSEARVAAKAPGAGLDAAGDLAAAGGLGALLGGLLEQMPPSLLQSVGDAARGQPGALEAASAQLREAIGSSGELSGLVSQLAGSLDPKTFGAAPDLDPAALAQLGQSLPRDGGAVPDLSELSAALSASGVDMDAMQNLAARMQSALAADPAATAAMVERLFGGGTEASSEGHDDWGEDATLPAPTKPR